MYKYIYENINQNEKNSIWDCEQDIKIKYKDFWNLVDTVFLQFTRQFIPKTKCAILCCNQLHTAVALLSCWKADLVPIILSMNYGVEHCRNIITSVEPDIAIVDCDECKTLFSTCVFNMENNDITGEIRQKPVSDDLIDIVLLLSTSGTTGKPKGVMITREGLIQNICGILNYFKLGENDSIFIARPLYHCAVLTGEFLVSLVKGLNIVFYSGQYNPMVIKNYIKKSNISVMCATPTLFGQLAALYKRNNEIGLLTKIVVSGECVSKEVAGKIREVFPETQIYNVYGLTENSPRVSFLSPDLFDSIPESVGIPLENTQIYIMDEAGREVKNGIKGQIVLRSSSIMKGYYKNPQETNKKIKNGLLQTGDIGFKDADGYLFVVSRMDDMIIKAGMNIYPLEIENIVLSHPKIRECMAYGIYKNDTEVIGLDVVLENICDIKILRQELWQLLPSYLCPDQINVVDKLARNASGKLVRKCHIQGEK